MQFKIFGKNLFEIKSSKAEMMIQEANSGLKESKFLPDFYGGWNSTNSFNEYIAITDSSGALVAVSNSDKKKKKEVKVQPTPVEKKTPKNIYDLRLLNDEKFSLNTNPNYIDSQLASFKDKLALINSEEYDMRRGVQEIGSVVVRLENRKKYSEFKDFFEQYPYTTTSKIVDVTKNHDHLKLGQIAQFIADLPKEAIEAMKQYNNYTSKLCGKQAVFYIIADKKDFQTTNNRRDPILVAQSPFGHFWQILGAWDKEMLFLEEL